MTKIIQYKTIASVKNYFNKNFLGYKVLYANVKDMAGNEAINIHFMNIDNTDSLRKKVKKYLNSNNVQYDIQSSKVFKQVIVHVFKQQRKINNGEYVLTNKEKNIIKNNIFF